ncbi:MAG: protein CpxP [Mariniflexile sp.]|jgi:hypothetical protein
MNKNSLLYILLVFLIIVNGFFLYNYLGSATSKNDVNKKGKGGPAEFIVKALKFDNEQMAKFEKINKGHHEAMVKSRDETKVLKDKLGRLIIEENISDAEVDSILVLLAEKEKAHEKMMFYNLRAIQAICTDEQKQHFEKIIKDALFHGGNRQPQEGPPSHEMQRGGPPRDVHDGPPPPPRP